MKSLGTDRRNAGKRKRVALMLAGMTLLLAPLTAGVGQVAQPQMPSYGQGPPRASDPLHPNEPPDPFAASNAAKMAHMREDERHKRLAADTAKLVELTNELKTEVDKASRDELSLDVVKKAAEIEKLAHDVKERMKS
jgi:hypothetical protein